MDIVEDLDLKTIKQVFASNLRLFRGKRTVEEIAEAADIPYRTYQEMETGRMSRPKNIAAVAKALGVPETRLFLDPDLLDVRPTVQTALKVVQEHIEMTGVIIQKDSSLKRQIARFTPDQMKKLELAIEAILSGESLELDHQTQNEIMKPLKNK